MSHADPGRPGEDPGRPGEEEVREGEVAALAKVVAVSSFRIGIWAAAGALDVGRRAVEVARNPAHTAELVEELRLAASEISRALLGEDVEPGADSSRAETADPVNPLHEAAQNLLRRSRDVWSEDRGHPAYARIIEELAPDEGRILLLLLRKGPQPSVDIRTGGVLGSVSSSLVRSNLNMIGALAGCRYVERVPSYLHNLERLGLIWFSSEMIRDPAEYQVLEAQPDVLEAKRSVHRPRAVRRSIHLTPFGEDFCRDGIGLHLSEEELGSVPPHRKPGEE